MPRRVTIADAKEYTKLNSSSILLEDTWVSSATPMRFRCSCGSEFFATWNKFRSQNKRRCNACAKKDQYKEKRLPMEAVIGTIESLGCEYVSGEYKNQKSKLELRCSCGELFTVQYDNFVAQGTGLCPTCSVKLRARNQAYTVSEVAMIAYAFGAELLSEEYDNAHEKLRFRCRCGQEFTTTLNCFLNSGKTKCSVCSRRESKGERAIREWLELHSVEFEAQKRFIDCGGNKPFPFDFYLPERNICIEFDGEQHFEESRLFKHYETTKAHDALKTKYCEEKGLNLIRIPYTDFDNIPFILGRLIPR